jgi:hypothetical protein
MNIKDIKLGDIIDVCIEGEDVHRLMIIEKGEVVVYGISSTGDGYAVEPRSEIEKIVVNINDL